MPRSNRSIAIMDGSTEAEEFSIGGAGLDDRTATVDADESGPIDPAAVGVAARRAAFRWWDPCLVLVIAAIGWLVCLFCAASTAWLLLGISAKLVAASIEFFAPLAFTATYYLAVLLVMRSLAKRRGHALFASYLPSIGIRPALYAALSGISLAGFYLIGILGLSLTSLFRNHPLLREAVPIPQSFGQLAVFGLVAVIIAPLTEELYWRGLVLDCLQRKLAPWVSALITALLFSFSHALFLVQPGIVGWMATAAVTGFGLLAAFWVQRTRSLRTAVAAHASYNATLILCILVFR